MTDIENIKAKVKDLIRQNELYESENATDAVRYQKTGAYSVLNEVLYFIDSLQEEPDMEAIIEESKQAQADDILSQVLEEPASEYSFNIESKLFHQLTPEQQKLWREEVEKAYNAGMTVVSADKNIDNAAAKTVEAFRHINLLNGDFLTLAEAQGSVNEYCKMVAIKAFKAGAKWQKDRMMLNTIDATCFGFQGAALFTFRLPAGIYLVGSKVKVIVINED